MNKIDMGSASMYFGTDSEFVPKGGVPGFACLPKKETPIITNGNGAARSVNVYEDAVCGEWGPREHIYSCFGYFMDAFRAAVQYMHKEGHTIGAGAKVKILPDSRMFQSGCNPTRSLFDGGEESPPISEDGYRDMIMNHGACCGTHFHMNVSSDIIKNPLPLIEDLVIFVYPLYRAMVAQYKDPFEKIRANSFYRGAFRIKSKPRTSDGVLEWKDISASVLRSPLIINCILGAIRAITKAHLDGGNLVLSRVKKEIGIDIDGMKKILSRDSELQYKKLALAALDAMTINAPNSPWAERDPTTIHKPALDDLEKTGVSIANLKDWTNGVNASFNIKEAVRKIVNKKYAFGSIEHEWGFRYCESHGYTVAHGLFVRGLSGRAKLTSYPAPTYQPVCGDVDIPTEYRSTLEKT